MNNKGITLRDIAGFCPEKAVWKMLADVTMFVIKNKTVDYISPNAIIVDGNNFILETNGDAEIEFLPPEMDSNKKCGESQIVWTLGALAYYMATGHVIFGGHGGIYQKTHASVALPMMPKSFMAIPSILHKCLCPNPESRICLNELYNLAIKGLTICEKQERIRIINDKENKVKYSGDKWPEEMIEL